MTIACRDCRASHLLTQLLKSSMESEPAGHGGSDVDPMPGIAEAALVSAPHCGVVQTRDAPMSPPQSDLVNSDGLQSNHAPTEDIVVSAVLFDVCDTACCALARRWAKTDARQSRSPSKLFEADVCVCKSQL